MADRTVTVKLEADVAGFVANVGGKAVAAVEALNAAAKKADTSVGKIGKDGGFEAVGKQATVASGKVSKLGVDAEASSNKLKASTTAASVAVDKVTASTTKASKATDDNSKAITASAKNADNYASALGRLRVAQLRLTETQNRKGSAGSSALAGAEESVASAERAVKKFEQAGNDSGKSFGAGLKKWLTGGGGGPMAELGKSGGTVFGSGFLGALKTPILGPIIVAALAAAVAIAAPAAGALAGAGLVAGIGGGLAGLGILFAAQSDAVGKKWSTTMSSLGEDMKLLSKPFESTLLNVATSFQRTVDKFNPALSKAFSSMAVPVGNFADDFAHSLEGLIPAIGPITEAFNAALAAMGGALPGAISQISDELTKLALSVSKNPQALADMVTGLGDIVGVTIGLITSLNDINTAFSTMTGGISLVDLALGTVSSTILILQGAFAPLGAVIGGVNALLGRTGKDSDTAGQSMADAADKTSALATALGGTGDAAQHAGPPILSAAEALQASKKAAADAATALQDYITKLFQLPNTLLSVRESQRGVQAAIDDATKSLKDNGRTLDIGTAKGRANQASLDAIATAANKQSEAYVRANASQKTMNAGAAEARTALSKVAQQFGLSKPAADAYAASVIKTPTAVATDFTNNADGKPKTDAETYAEVLRGTLPAVNTIITNNGAGTPKTNAERYRDLLGLVPRAVPTVVTNTAPVAKDKVNQYRTALGLVPQAKSTSVSTPGAAASQGEVSGLLGLLGALPASKSTNIYTNMIQTTTYKTVGVRAPGLPQADGGYYPGGVPSYADGKLPGQAMVAPGKGRGLVQWAEQETGGEAFIPLAPSKRDRSEKILGQVASSFGLQLVKSFAGGGFNLPGGRLVSPESLLSQLGTPFNPLSGINYSGTLATQTSALKQFNTALATLNKARTAGNPKALAAAWADYQKKLDAARKATDAHTASVEALTAQQKDALALADQIAGKQLSGAGIVDLFGGSLTAKGLLGDLQGQGQQTAEFAKQLASLRKLGLSQGLLQQLADAGSASGGDVAQSILDAGKGMVDALNKAQTNLEKQADIVGSGVATDVYGKTVAGKRAGGGGVMAGKTYEVNERGQEYFTAPVNGQIVPHGVDPRRYINGGSGSGGGGTTVVEHHYHQTNQFSGVDYTTADVIAQRSTAKQQLMGRY